MGAINNGLYRFVNTARKIGFKRYGGPSAFEVGVGYWGVNKLLTGSTDLVQKRGNIAMYNSLYTDGTNLMGSGRRGIDSQTGGQKGLVQGLHSNRRKY